MQGTSLILFIVGAMVVLNLGMVALTLGVKALRIVGRRRKEKRASTLEAVLEDSLFSGEVHPGLREVRGRNLDLLAVLMVEYLTVLSGGERARLAALAEEAGLVSRYHRMLTARNRWRRARAAENLGYFGGFGAVTALSGLLSDPDETLRAVAARALARIGTPEAAEKLAETLNDSSELTRLRMAENLERIGPLAVAPLVETLESGAPGARVLAARVLGNLRAADARQVLSRVARQGDSTDLRAQATLALGKAGDPEDLPVLLEACEDEEWPVRAQAANALEIVGDTSSIPALQKLTVDREWWVRLNASRALANMGPEGEKALARVLDGADRYARDRAVSTLEERGITRRAVGQLADEGEQGESSRALIQAMVKAGATRYLGGLRNKMPPGPERDLLTAILDGSAPEASPKPAAEYAPPEPETALPAPKKHRENGRAVTPTTYTRRPAPMGSGPETARPTPVPRRAVMVGEGPEIGASRDNAAGAAFVRRLGKQAERATTLHHRLEENSERGARLVERCNAELGSMRAYLETVLGEERRREL